MDASKVSEILIEIIRNSNDNPVCTLLDGGWGIGKTHIVKDIFNQDTQFEMVYVSFFGKTSIREIENALLIKTIPGFKNIEDTKGKTKVLGSIVKDLVGKYSGLDIGSYLNSFSIEDIKRNNKDGKRKVICFDDLERKSDSLEMKEILGLIERATVNFDVILIANTNELTTENRDLLNTYNEKVIDYQLKLDKLTNSMLKNIIKDIGSLNKDELIEVYFENMMGFGSIPDHYLARNLMNLRIFKKYIDLVHRSSKEIGYEKVNLELLRMCKAVVYDYYFPEKEKKQRSTNFDRFNLYRDLKQMFLFENRSENSFELFKKSITQIREDINLLYKLYSLNEDQYKTFIEGIDYKIKKGNLDYFVDQSSIISLASAFEENDLLDEERFKGLLKIAYDVYIPNENSKYTPFIHTEWNSIDDYGNELECSKKIKLFIEKLNAGCINKYNIYLKERISTFKSSNDYDKLLDLYNDNQIDEISEFEEIFDYFFSQLAERYTEEIDNKIQSLINKTKSELIINFFDERIVKESSFTKIKKYKHYNYFVSVKLEIENELENHILRVENDRDF